ncbi:MAG: hypothetical protein M3Q03_10890 [Chloroflexota bacterium]|nr:hypothetical protein [Chloroflexota bacterium]
MREIITGLQPGSFGFIASDARTSPWKLMHYRGAVAHDEFDGLPGDPHHHLPVRVTPFGLANPGQATAA